MNEEKQFPQRKPTRLKCFDYNTASAYFITICTEQRRNVLSWIVGVDVLGDLDNVMLLLCGKSRIGIYISFMNFTTISVWSNM